MRVTLISLAAFIALLAGCGGANHTAGTGKNMVIAVDRGPWNSSQSNGVVLTRAHYRVYTTVQDGVLVRYLPGFMEAARDNYLSLTGLSEGTPGEPLPVYMMSTRQEWIQLSEKIFGRGQQVFHSIEAGGYCYRGVCVFWDIGGIQTFSVASHEGLHQFLNHRLKSPLPLWLEEGLCSAAEGYRLDGDRVEFTPQRNNSRFTGLRTTIINDRWMPIEQLLPLGGGDVAVKGTERAVGYYSQLWALTLMLRSHPVYRAGLERLMADAEAGQIAQALDLPPALANVKQRTEIYNRSLAEPLFRHYITNDFAQFDKEYLAFAKKLANLEP